MSIFLGITALLVVLAASFALAPEMTAVVVVLSASQHFTEIPPAWTGVAYAWTLAAALRLVRSPTTRSYRAIEHVETLLIGMALAANPRLLNRSKTKLFKDLWIKGFMNAGPGEGIEPIHITLLRVCGQQSRLWHFRHSSGVSGRYAQAD